MIRRLPISTLFPYTTLFRSVEQIAMVEDMRVRMVDQEDIANHQQQTHFCGTHFPLGDLEYAERIGGQIRVDGQHEKDDQQRDRKSTRLNSSHRCISYAVFCL